MIDLRTLGYFLVACEQENLIAAADRLGIATSTLSASLKGLEGELGVSLFRRTGSGVYPRASARWLYRQGLPLMVLEALARASASAATPVETVELEVRLAFALGWVSRALSGALLRLGAGPASPRLLVKPAWRLEPEPDGAPGWLDGLTLAGSGRVVLETSADAVGADVLAEDPWVVAARPSGGDANGPRPLIVPALPPPLRAQIDAYLAREGREARFLPDPPGAMPRLLAENPESGLLAPGSLIAPRLGLPNVAVTPLEPPLSTHLIARIETPGPGAERLIQALKDGLAEHRAPRPFAPELTARRLRYFGLAWRHRRISAAAREANVAQPALSEQLKKLEASVGVSLFERRSEGLAATPAGVRFEPFAKALEAGLVALSLGGATARPDRGGRLSLGVLPTVSQHGYLINRIAEAALSLRQRYPALELAVQEGPNATLQTWVTRGQVGLAIVETAPPQMPRLPLGASESLAAIADPRHGLLPPGPVTLTDLVKTPLALQAPLFGLRQLIEAAARAEGLEVKPRFQIDSLGLLIALLRREPVATVLPPSAVQQELEAGALIAHPIVEPEIERRLYVIYSGARSLTEPERTFVELLRGRLAEES